MSITQSFSRGSGGGFSRYSLARQANRQFQLSLALIAILAVAASAVSVGLWLDDIPQAANATQIMVNG